MKLPGNANMGVQSLGRETGDSSHRGRAELGAAAVEIVDDFQERKTRHEISLADVAVATWDSEFSRKYDGQDVFDREALPKDVQKEFADREKVPAFEVRASLYERSVHEMLEERSGSISDKRAREEWLIGKKEVAAGHISARYLKRNQEQETYYNAEVKDAAWAAVDNGNYAGALHLVERSNLPAEEKRALKQAIAKRQESDAINDMILAGDLEGLRQMLQVLSSSDYDGPFKDEGDRVTMVKTVGREVDHLTERDRKITIGNDAEALVQKLMADPDMTATEQNERLSAVKDDEVRQEARSRLKNARDRRKKAEDEETTRKSEEFIEAFRANPDPDMFAEAPDAKTEKALRDYYDAFAKGVPVVTDMRTYLKVRQDILDLKPVQLSLYMGKISDVQLRELAKLQDSDLDGYLRKGAQSRDEEIESAMIRIGVDPSDRTENNADGRKALAVFEFIDRQLVVEAEQKGKPLTYRERKEITDQVTLKFSQPGFLFDSEVNLDDVLEDIPQKDLLQIEQVIREQGNRVTPEEILTTYERHRNGR